MLKLPMDTYMKTLSGFINDEDLLVTYKWLSNELEVHVNTAKLILENYWEKYKNDGIFATVLIIGYIKGKNALRIDVVNESDLSKIAIKYDKILSQHLYSLQKTSSNVSLLLANRVRNKDVASQFGAIKCDKCVILSDEELYAKRWGSKAGFKDGVVEPVLKTHFSPKKVQEKSEITKKLHSSKKTGFGNLFGSGNKKRKRITVVSDDSDEEIEKKVSSPPLSSTGEETMNKDEKSPSPLAGGHGGGGGGKRKVRKVVDNTYVDENGYLITKKVHVYESCSEEDEPPRPLPPSIKLDEPKKINNKKMANKQTSLMSFFKKT